MNTDRESKSFWASLERKYCAQPSELTLIAGSKIEGYASLFGVRDQGGDVVQPGAYGTSLRALHASGRRVKMLWQHEPREPIGVWDEVGEDANGLFVQGRLLTEVARAREAAALVEAGAIDGLSIGYRTIRAAKDSHGRRVLSEIELWEVSLVTFPMLPEARVDPRREESELAALRSEIDQARQMLARV